ncbi:MAG: hypothetical protein KDD43_12995, partial [Bdellovibrionales bacterium]|nr:hypothetical protein [Bdellovibrionales bacterium]
MKTTLLFLAVVLVAVVPSANIDALETHDPVKKIVVLGDSIADGFGVDKDKSYPALLEIMLKKKGHSVKVVNAGISGSTT